MLQRDNAVIAHNRNLQALAIQMYQLKHKLAPKVIQDLFSVKEEKLYNLRYKQFFKLGIPKTTSHGTKSVRYLGPKIWNILSETLQNATSLQ